MTKLTRRSLLCASAATVAATFHVTGTDAASGPDIEWTAVHDNLAYLKSQKKQLKPAMRDLTALFPHRVPVELDKDFNGLPGFMFFIEIIPSYLGSKAGWTFLHNQDLSILLATDAGQLSLALKHLNKIARKGPARDEEHPAYPRGIPLVVELPIGVTTSMPVHRVA